MVELHRAGRRIPELAREFGPTPWTIALWVKQADRDAGRGDGGLTSSERAEPRLSQKPRPGLDGAPCDRDGLSGWWAH
jgi:transposase-like protein